VKVCENNRVAVHRIRGELADEHLSLDVIPQLGIINLYIRQMSTCNTKKRVHQMFLSNLLFYSVDFHRTDVTVLRYEKHNLTKGKTMNIIKYSFALLVLASGIALGANNNAPSNKNIVETAVEAGSFKTLAAALQAGDLIDALSGDTEFTVFAPTDEAFAKLPKGTLESLLKPENKDKLVAILKYHVVKGRVTSKKVVKLNEATTIGGKTVKISTSKGVMVNNAKVVKVDINCKNGVIHVIDTVLIP
jgi:uncharacterized surface protein with fasciclin (FAS1) repeats